MVAKQSTEVVYVQRSSERKLFYKKLRKSFSARVSETTVRANFNITARRLEREQNMNILNIKFYSTY